MKKKNKMTSPEIASFCSQMALLLKAGITPRESMRVLLNDCHSETEQQVFEKIYNIVEIGASFHDALESTGAFPDYCLNLIALGEEAGKLDVCLESLSEHYEREENFHSSIRHASSYPFIMIITMLAVIGLLLLKVMPTLVQISEELNITSSNFAGLLLVIGQEVSKYSFFALLILFVLFLLLYMALRIEKLRKFCRRMANKIPFLRNFTDDYARQRFASGMALTLNSGLDAFGSLDLVAELVGTPAMKEKVLSCKAQISAGSTLADALINSKILNHLHSRMITIGFNSGTIDQVMQQIADIYEKDNEKRRNNLLATLQPTCIIVLTVLLGITLMSVLLSITGILASLPFLV